MNKQEEYQRAQRAENILKDEVFNELLDELEQEHLASWKNAETSDERENLWRMVRAIGEIRKKLKILVDRKLVIDKRNEQE